MSFHHYSIPDVIPGQKCHKHKSDFQGYGMLHSNNVPKSTYTNIVILNLQYMLKSTYQPQYTP
jgi:hypothetical protein